MQSFVKPQLICGVFLLFAVIVRAEENLTQEVTIEQISEPASQLKSPFWDQDYGKLYVSDTYNNELVCVNIATGKLTYASIANVSTGGGLLGPVVPVEGGSHQFIAGLGQNFVLFTWDSDANFSDPEIEILGSVDTDRIGTRFNEGRCDSHGRFWAGTRGTANASQPLHTNPNEGSLYRLTSDLVIEKELSPVGSSDGIAWNKEDTILYYVDSVTYQIAAFDFDAVAGKISNKRIVFDFKSQNISGVVHGIAVDTNGDLWVPMYKTGHLLKVDPAHGELLQTVQMPTQQLTSPVFGGDSFDVLYVASRYVGATPEQHAAQPGAGAIFAVKGLGVQGFAGNKFILDKKH